MGFFNKVWENAENSVSSVELSDSEEKDLVNNGGNVEFSSGSCLAAGCDIDEPLGGDTNDKASGNHSTHERL